MLQQACLLSLLALIPSWITARFEIDWGPAPEFRPLPARKIQQQPAHYRMVDVRNRERFEAGHAPDALWFSEETYPQDLEKLRPAVSNRRAVVVYGEGVGSDRATKIARRLRQDLAPMPVFLLDGGWASWPRDSSP